VVSDGLLLALDAADSTGTAALLRDGALIAEEAVAMRAGPDDAYFPAILALFAGAGVSPRDLAAVACGAGPGSFTSLRVAGALAKGLAVGGGIPLYGVPSLALLVAASDATRAPGSRWLASLDALRGDRYLALVTIGPDGAVSTASRSARASWGRPRSARTRWWSPTRMRAGSPDASRSWRQPVPSRSRAGNRPMGDWPRRR
jgi:tRNA threonylcarbamoyl adenosine modification protein YeaZ